MSPGAWLRRAFYLFVVLLFSSAVLGMFVTGPVVVRVPRIDMNVEPSPGHLRTSVERLCFEYSPRSYRDLENLDEAANWIGFQLAEAGLEVEFQSYELEEGGYRNVVGRRPGSDPSAPAIVIGAHYDTVAGTPGANDNASGVAVLLELARTLPPIETERTHYLVAFSTEEPPYFGTPSMGSYRFARKLRDEGTEVLLMVSLDMVGSFSDRPGSQSFPTPWLRLLYPGRGDFIAVIGDAGAGKGIDRAKRGMMAGSRLPVHSFRAPAAIELVHMSDHLSFRRLGMQAVQITDTAFLRYPHYHKATDMPEMLDYEKMGALVRSLHGILWEGD